MTEADDRRRASGEASSSGWDPERTTEFAAPGVLGPPRPADGDDTGSGGGGAGRTAGGAPTAPKERSPRWSAEEPSRPHPTDEADTGDEKNETEGDEGGSEAPGDADTPQDGDASTPRASDAADAPRDGDAPHGAPPADADAVTDAGRAPAGERPGTPPPASPESPDGSPDTATAVGHQDAAARTASEQDAARLRAADARPTVRPRPADERATSRETTSEFAVPDGLAPPRPADDRETTSEFAVPEGLERPAGPRAGTPARDRSAFRAPRRPGDRLPVSFTPATGVPMPDLGQDVPWQDRMRTMLRMPVAERPAPDHPPREEERPAVPRVLDLTLRIGELLLSGGEGAEDVEAAMFAVCRAFGLDRCEPTVTFTQLSISYQPSLVDDPVTASRTVRRRGTDYTRLAAVFRLVDDLSAPDAQVSLEEAYRRLAEIRRNRHPYPVWALNVASGLLAGAASVLVGGDLRVFLAAVLGAMLGDRLAWLCAGRGLPEFYQFTVAAMPPAAIAVALRAADVDLKASAVITGGLFALLPGRALVAGVQDGLTGFYITAAARLLEVLYLFVGIVMGVLIVLYFGVRMGAELSPDAALVTEERPLWQLGAAVLLSLMFAVLLQQEPATVVLVALNGGVAWTVYGAMRFTADLSPVLSTAVAAGLVGLFGQLLSRYRYASALPYTTAALGPLLPGSATYFGLLGIAQDHLDRGLASLATAASLAMAIAIGVNLGSEIFRLFLRVPQGFAAQRRAAKRTRGF